MDYVLELTIPADTAESDYVSESLTLPAGSVDQVSVLFPAGCLALAHVVVYLEGSQIWPSSPDSDYYGDDMMIVFRENLELREAWNRIEVRGWNEDDTYDHTVTVRITLLEDKVPAWAKHIFGGLFKR